MSYITSNVKMYLLSLALSQMPFTHGVDVIGKLLFYHVSNRKRLKYADNALATLTTF